MVKKRESAQKLNLPDEFLERLKAVIAKRPKTVIDHILQHGFITTEELKEKYGYDHPPRAARDVREQGIPLETFRITGKHGRKIGAYRFDEPSKVRGGKLGGRKAWPKNFKDTLGELNNLCCGICSTKYESRYLQIDHRVPFEVAGDPKGKLDPAEFMLVCGSCNRAKSWSCEHCKNWTTDQLIDVCKSCYWATPENYVHVALQLIRRLDVSWLGKEALEYDRLVKLSKHARKRLPDFVKAILRERIVQERKGRR